MTLSPRHRVLIIEDDPDTARTLGDMMKSMDFDCRVATTLDEVRAIFPEYDPCAVLQDMQVPHAVGARPDENAGESSIAFVRQRSRGPTRVTIVVVTAFRTTDADWIWHMSEIEVDAFVAKSNIAALPGKLRAYLKKNGREHHASCARCNAESRPPEAAPRDGAIVFSHEHPLGAPVDAAGVRALVDGRSEYDLFLDYATSAPRGYLAGYRDHEGAFRETFLGETHAAIVAELVQARRVIRADAFKRLKGGSFAAAVRLVQEARKAVDVKKRVGGRESRTGWRAIQTVGGKGAVGFVFEPGLTLKYAVAVTG